MVGSAFHHKQRGRLRCVATASTAIFYIARRLAHLDIQGWDFLYCEVRNCKSVPDAYSVRSMTAFSPPEPAVNPLSFRAPPEFGFMEDDYSVNIIRIDLATPDEHFIFPRSAPRHPICRMANLTAPFVSAACCIIVNDLVWDKV